MGIEIPWTFKTWIEKFKGVDLPIGDLADDILRDPEFPEDDDFTEIYEHLSSKSRGSSGVLETFALVWAYYQASR